MSFFLGRKPNRSDLFVEPDDDGLRLDPGQPLRLPRLHQRPQRVRRTLQLIYFFNSIKFIYIITIKHLSIFVFALFFTLRGFSMDLKFAHNRLDILSIFKFFIFFAFNQYKILC